MVFQFFNLLAHLTVRENVELPRRLDGQRDASARAAEAARARSASRAARRLIRTSFREARCSAWRSPGRW